MASAKNVAQAGSKDQMIESAILLMRQSGLSGAGINQIIQHSRAPKGSMYYHFPGGKMQLSREALERFGKRVAENMRRALESKRKPAEKIRALFESTAGRFEQCKFSESCAAGAVALDLTADVYELRPVLAEIMLSWRRVIEEFLPIRSKTRRESMAGLVLTALEGGYVRGRAERSSDALLEAGDWLAKLVDAEAAAG